MRANTQRFICLAAAAALATAGLASVDPAVAAAKRSCGTQTYHGAGTSATLRVTVEKGRVSCRTARRVFRDLAAGKGTEHSKPGQGMAGVTVTIGKWTCGYFAGGDACSRGPLRRPTALIKEIDVNLPG